MIVGNHFIEKHHIIVIEGSFFDLELRLCVSDHRISKISDESSGKWRKSFKPWCFVIF